MRIFILFLSFICCFTTAVTATETNAKVHIIKVWSWESGELTPDNQPIFSIPDDKFDKKISISEKTPDGEKSLEITLKGQKGNVVHAKQINFNVSTTLISGREYRSEFWIKANKNCEISAIAAQLRAPFSTLGPHKQATAFDVGQEWRKITVDFKAAKNWDGEIAAPMVMPGLCDTGSVIYFGTVKFSEILPQAAEPAAIQKTSAGKVVNSQKKNLLINSSFKLGQQGYECNKILRPETNPGLKFEGPVIEPGSSICGKQSLRIPNRYAEETHLCSDFEVKLNPGEKYTVSAWMKSAAENCPVTITGAAYTHDKSVDLPYKDFIVTNNWKRYSFQITTPDKYGDLYYRFRIMFCRGLNDQPGDLWVDRMQVSSGDSGEYGASDIEAAITPDQNLYILEDGERKTAAFKCSIVNNTALPATPEITVNIIDDYYRNIVMTKKFRTELAPDETKTVEFEMPLKKFGVFEACAEISGAANTAIIPGYFAVINKYDNLKPIDIDKMFCVSFNKGDAGFVVPPNFYFLKKPGFRAIGGDPDTYYKILAQSGCRLIRDWGNPMCAWRIVEPEDGKWDFTWGDLTVKFAGKHGISFMPVPGGSDMNYGPEPWTNNGSGWPARIMKMKYADADKELKEKRAVTVFPPVAEWEKYIRNLTAHYKGKITHYEIMNEPNLFCESPARYMEYLKSAYKVIKETDPDAKVVGFCSTGDMKGDVKGFFEDCFKLDGLKYADSISFHPYDARELGSKYRADKQIEDINQLTKKYCGKTLPLWNTEMFYYHGKSWEHLTADWLNANYAIRRVLTDLGEGVRQSCWMQMDRLFKHQTAGGWFVADAKFVKWQPWTLYVAHNALARLFERAIPVEKIKLPNDVIFYVYELEGEYIAAFWYYGAFQNQKVNISLGISDKEASLFDIFGNPLPLDLKPLPLAEAPYYLKWKGKDLGAFIAVLKKAVIESGIPVLVTGAKQAPCQDSKGISLTLKNNSNKPVLFSLDIKGEGFITQNRLNSQIDALTEKSFVIPVKITGQFPPDEISANISAGAKDTQFTKIKIANGQARFYYVPNDKNGDPDATLIRAFKRKDSTAKPMEATFSAGHDENNLYIFANVKDESPSGDPNGRNEWEQDCVELFFDADPLKAETTDPGSYHDYNARIFVIPYAPDGKKITFIPGKLSSLTSEKVKLETVIIPSGYTIKLSIPLEALNLKPPLSGKFIGFDIAVDDADGDKGRHLQRFWSSSAGTAHKDRNELGYLCFK